MKNVTLKPNFKQLIKTQLTLLLILALSLPTFAAKEGDKEMKSSVKFDGRPNVSVMLYDSETDITKASGNEITIKINYIAEGLNEEELKILEKSMKENLLQKSGNKITISTRFYESYQSFVIIGIRKTKMKLKSGEELSMTKFKVTNVAITLPDDMDLKLNSKYNEVKIDFDIKGDVEIKGYDLKFYGQKISGTLDIDGRYSTLNLKQAGDTKLKLYESKVDLTGAKDLDIDSRYSKVKLLGCESLKIKGYEDRFESIVSGDVEIDGRYSDYTILSAENINAKMYEGSILLPKVNGTFTLNGRYVEVNISYINALKLQDGYENNLKIKEANEVISKKGRYNEFDIDKLNNKIEVEGYEEEVEILELSSDFEKVLVDGKYMELKIDFKNEVNYLLHGAIQYPDLDVDMNDFDVVLNDKDGSRLDFKYIRGTNKNTTKEIYLKGYEVDAKINHN